MLRPLRIYVSIVAAQVMERRELDKKRFNVSALTVFVMYVRVWAYGK